MAERTADLAGEFWQAYSGSEEEWQAARERLLEAIQAFNAAVRQEVQR